VRRELFVCVLLLTILFAALVTLPEEVRASSTLTLNPMGDGHETDWTPKSGSDHYLMVDEGYGGPPDDDTTYVSVGAANAEEYFTMDDHTSESGAISNVRLYLRLYQDNSEEYAFAISNGSTENIGSDIAAPASWTTVYTDYATNPLRAGADWSWTDIDNLQAGVSSEAAGGWGGTEYLTVVWVNVTYTRGPGTNTWSAAANANWNVDSSWSLGVPIDGDDVVFDTTSTFNCNVDITTPNLDSFLMDTGYTGTVDLNANTLNVEYTADGSDFTGTQGTFDGDTGTVEVSGDITVSSTLFTLTYGTSTFDHTGTGTIYGRDADQNSFYNLKVAAAGKTTSIQDVNDPRVTNGQFTIGTGTLQRSGGTTTGIYLYGNNANPVVNNGGTISFVQLSYKVSVASNIPAGTNYYHIGIQSNNGATLQGDITLSSQLFIGRGNPAFVDTANYAITTNELRIGASVYANYIDPGSSTIDIGTGGVTVAVANSYILGDTSTWTVAGGWTSVSTSALWDEGTMDLTFDGTTQNVDNNELDFYDVTVGATSETTFTDGFDVGGNLTVN